MSKRRLLLLAVAAACGGRPSGRPTSFLGPSALSVFVGRTPAHPDQLWPYVAVANARSDELRILDPASDQTLLSPGRAFPLSVPTLQWPLYVAAASLSDNEPDVLVVAGVGAQVQLVSSWEDGIDRTDPLNPRPDPSSSGPRVVASYDLSAEVGPAAQILSMTGSPVPGPLGGNPPVGPPVPGRARILVGFSGSTDGSGGKLVVLEFRRGPGGSVELAASPEVKPLGFDPLALALSPDNYRLYAGTTDVITDTVGGGQVRGVAEVDMSPGSGALWPIRGFDARGAGTTLVAAAMVGERLQGDAETFAPPALRVYAALELAGCGSDRSIECGIATFDPALGGLAGDPAPAGRLTQPQTYRTPIFVPAAPVAMAVALPAATGPQVCFPECEGGAPQPSQPLMLLAPGSGQRWSTAIAVVATADGNAYVLDLGRYSAPDNVSLLNPAGKQNLRVTAAVSAVPAPAPLDYSQLGLFVEHPDSGTEYLTASSAQLPLAIMLTPGFTKDEQWSLVWQGVLPGLGGAVPSTSPADWPPGAGLACVLGRMSDGSLYLAMQKAGGTTWVPTARVSEPSLGIHPADRFPQGDIAQFKAETDPAGCEPPPGQPAHEGAVTSILPEDPLIAPGGALQLAASSPDLQCLEAALAASPVGSVLTGECAVRSSGLVLSGSVTGYAGRPEFRTRYNFMWSEESLLSGEDLVLARKARRFYYAGEGPCAAASCPGYPEFSDPLAAGPVLGFKPGVACVDPGPPATWLDCQDDPARPLARGAVIAFATSDGVEPMFRAPDIVSLARDAVALDKSLLPGLEAEGTVVYLAYEANVVFEVLPGSFVTLSKTLR